MVGQLVLFLLASAVGSCFSVVALAQTDSFAGKIVFFGARHGAEMNSTISTWSPAEQRVVKFVSTRGETFFRGRISPDASMLAVAVATTESNSSFEAPDLEIIESDGRRRKILRAAEPIAWFPDSKSVLCRRGKKYEWSHIRVFIGDGRAERIIVAAEDAVMDVSSEGSMSVMKGRPDVIWERAPGDFYPKRQLYEINGLAQTLKTFTSEGEDCIWWRYRPEGAAGAYYRRHYAIGRPIETAMLKNDAEDKQIANFTELGVRPSGSPAWNPDGKEIAWVVQREAAEDQFEHELMFIQLAEVSTRFITAKDLGLSWLGAIDWR